ncbi:protein ELYS-like [Littorina saxatilis]|uniref:Protein ELYS n=1 Tax=Littorina saxatilis TaxID=31220 RepID=A0AAN9AUD6_9CAEN
MRQVLRPSQASELVPFQACSVRRLDSCEFANAHSGLSEDGTLTWVYKGAALEVLSTHTGRTVASLNTENLLRDMQATIVCVCEFRCHGRARLAVGVNGAAEQGTLVLLDVASSVIVRAVEIPQQVTAVERVLTYGGRNVPQWALSQQLRQFHGILAVGTMGGYLYLVDMSLDSPSRIDVGQKVMPSPLMLVDPRERDLDALRQHAALTRQHLAVLLGVDEQTHSNDCFHFRRPDLTVVQTFNEDEIQVSCLKYIPQSGTLAIGYSFGGFHLWKLFNPVLEFTSSVEPEDLPVAFFVYQEPENDPRNFAYIWVCSDDHLSEQKQESLCSVTLYQLSYSRRTFYANYGSFYEEVNSVVQRLHHNLTMDPYNSRHTSTWSSQLLSAITIADPNYHPPANLTVNDSFEESCLGPDLSLCAFVWEAQDSRPGGTTQVFYSIFDMNRWYHAQMPSRIKCVNVGGQEVCPYFAVYHMDEAVLREGCGSLLDVQLKPGSLLRFLNNSPMPPEQHFYPSSLTFETTCVLTNGIISASILGVQRQVLASVESSGPLCLLKPFDLYHRCIQAGLLARTVDTSSTSTAEEQQRMSLLTLALEQGKIRFIAACVRSWADGEFYHQGCTLQFLLSWSWARVTAIKQQVDTACQPLFNWSGAPVDQRMMQVLQTCVCCLGHLNTVLHLLLTQASPVTDQGQVELEHRIKVVTLLHHHLKVTLWFVHNGLLPEQDESKESSPGHYVYPATELSQVFTNKRQLISHRGGLSSSGSDSHTMILIDALVYSAGDSVTQLWKSQGGSGLYPPPSLHAALSVYLLDGVEETTKNAILLYLLFDMAAISHGHEAQFAEKIPLFSKTFELPRGLMHQMNACWLIDHMNFEEGLKELLGHGSFHEVGAWQHGCILRALMHHGEVSGACQYLSARNPPIVTPDDLRMRLTIMVANRLVWQAVAYVRHSCGSVDQEAMLTHIFHQCHHYKLMEMLFKLPLTECEEQCLQHYLSVSADPTAAELLVLHLLQRAQYVPAIRLNDRMKHRATMDQSGKARERAKTRNTVVEGFRHALPATQQYLINHPPSSSTLNATRKVDVVRPKPLSTAITQHAERRANCQSSLIMAVMDKVAQAGTLLARHEEGDREKQETGVAGHKRDLPESDTAVINKPGPFLCTPSTPRVRSRLSVASQVVYPAVRESTVGFLSTTLPASPLSPTANTTLRRSRVFTADCMSLLQTPKIEHTPARITSPQQRATPTPHSILKVSRLPRSSPKAKGGVLSPKGRPKRLGFTGSLNVSTSLPPTPTEVSPSATPSPTSATAPLAPSSVSRAKTDLSNTGDVATPKHIRFAESQIHEISPLHASPDDMSRPSLHTRQGTSPGETAVVSDEEVTFNFSTQVTQVTEAMDTENDLDSSTVPLPSPSPDISVPPTLPSPPPSTVFPPPLPERERPMEDEGEELESHLDDRMTRKPLHPSQSLEAPHTSSQGPSATLAHAQGAPYTKISPRTRERSPKVSPKGRERSPKAKERSPKAKERSPKAKERSPKVSPKTQEPSPAVSPQKRGRNAKVRERSPLVVETDTMTDSRLSWSPQVSPRSRLSDGREVIKQTSVVKETRQTSHMSGEYRDEYEIRVVKSATETRVVFQTSSPGDLAPVIECEDGTHPSPTHSLEAMETIEPAEENLLMTVREAKTPTTVSSATHQTEDMVEIADEIQTPTPIRPPSLKNTPERSVKSVRVSRRGKLRKDLATASVEEAGETTESTPPKLRRVSLHSQPPAAGSEVWPDEMPDLRVEVSDDENSNDNRSQPSPLPSSPSRRVTRSVNGSPPVSPSRRVTRSVNGSPPVSPSRRSVRQSVDRSPPPSPSRRSSRKSEERGATPERTRRPSKATAEKDTLTVQTESSSDEMMPPPPSPTRRATRLKTPERSSARKTRSHDTGMESSDSGVESSKLPDSVTSTDTEPPTAAEDDIPKSPGRQRRSSRRSTTPDTTRLPVTRSKSPKTPEQEPEAPKSPSRSPGRRATRGSQAAESKKPESASRRAARGGKDQEEEAKSPGRLSTRRAMTPDPLKVSEPASPSRRSRRLSHTPEPASPSRVSTPHTKTTERSVSPPPPSPSRGRRGVKTDVPAEGEEDPLSATPGKQVQDAASVSPARRPARSERSESADSVPASPSRRSARSDTDKPAPVSPSRRSLRASMERSVSGDSVESTSGASTGRSKTPEPSSPARLRGKGSQGEGQVAMEVKDIAMATEELRSNRRQQKESLQSSVKAAEETGDAPSFQFAPPTPLSRVQADTMGAGPSSNMAAFIFSPPITRTARSRTTSTSSTPSVEAPSRSLRSASVEPEPAVEEETAESVPDDAASTSEVVTETAPRKVRRPMQSRKKSRTAVPSASPTDSPINLVSPGQPTSADPQPERGSRLPARKAKPQATTRGRVLRKRKAKLW